MRSRARTRILTLAGAVALAGLTAAPAAHAAASGCTHNWSGPQICIATTGESGHTYPGTITATWTNPPKSRNKATVYLTNWSAGTIKMTAKRHGDEIKGSWTPQGNPFKAGELCARFKGSSVKACVDLINR
ncbi:hypothetical protein [Streptomyces decoyicus]|uniref:hypothetical protein n=1 Tax=Streptomyces decoyicus TaxID=249567 RepID=UPI0004AAF2FB|nr:hypothetical protein [Streptomyces decoyicus]KOG49819.1 hypothetical protein ADK74_03320 [Streptomyces decoyicus]QZY16703.1 hypothetical protein K7C20_16775 [Streptomyces decoyicus]